MTNDQHTFRLPDNIDRDLENFYNDILRCQSGAIPYEQFRPIHVPFGIYNERQPGRFMLRVRLPGGIVLPHQMRRIVEVARDYGDGIPHVTTRQDIQIHRVTLDHLYPALGRLLEAGLTTKGGGGDTVRNITGCPHAGVCRNEAFDVTPYVTSLTESLLNRPDSFKLPRKFKIAFSGCSRDCAGATIHDVGFIARRQNGDRGFAVYAAGGLGANKRVADRLEDFLPDSEVGPAAEAIKQVFYHDGDRENRGRARLRFLAEKIGWDAFRDRYLARRQELQGDALPRGPIDDEPKRTLPPAPAACAAPVPDGFDRWKERYTLAQKQDGFFLVQIPLFLGDIAHDQLVGLAELAESCGEGLLRATARQNLVLRWVPQADLPRVYRDLRALDLTGTGLSAYHNIVACTGASTCRLGICLSRGVARAIAERLAAGNFPSAIADLPIYISGCPNSCGRHPIAPIGLMGAARKAGDHSLPFYILSFGGKLGEGETRFGSRTVAVAAKHVPNFLADLLTAFTHCLQYPNFDAFLDACAPSVLETLAEKYRAVPTFQENRDFYRDWGASEDFSLAERGHK